MPVSIPRFTWTTAPCDAAAVAALAARFGLPPPAAAVLAGRGLTEPDAVGRFLEPRLPDLGDPFAMPGMAAAARQILDAVGRRDRIAVFGDFDADGVVAAHVLAAIIRRLGGDAIPFLPDRLSEGYGLSPAAVARCLSEVAPRLLVTVDCGMGAEAEIATVRAAGVAVIVTDHHSVTGTLPPDLVVVNPNLPGTPPGAAHLCGAGVAFKLGHALVKTARADGHSGAQAIDLRDWLDAVSVATVADVVPLLGENRILVAAGLHRLARHPCVGLKALMNRAGLSSGAVGSYHLGFVLGPRLNAAGRMRSAHIALNLLNTTDWDQAMAHAIELEQLNALRRQTEADLLGAAHDQLATWFDADRHGAVIAGGADWHPGTLGIVAARLSEAYQRPAAVVALDAAGGGRGSVRAGQAYDAMAAMGACVASLARYGGHARAGGFSLKPGSFATFREQFAAACHQQAGAPSRQPALRIDAWLEASQLDAPLWQAIQRLEPFGEGHPTPRWGLRGVRLDGAPRPVGREGEHLRLNMVAAGRRFGAVWFRQAALLPAVTAQPGAFDVVFELHENTYQGNTSLDLHVVDMRPAEAKEA